MFWKIMFWIYAIVYTLFIIYSNFQTISSIDTNSLSIMEAFVGFISFIIIPILSISYLYAMGWKKKLFSKKANNVILGLFILNILLFSFVCADNLRILEFLILFFVITIVQLIIFSVPIIAYIMYRLKCEGFQPVEKPYWKIFAIFTCFNILDPIFLALYICFRSGFSPLDLIIIPLTVISVIFAIGFAFNKKIFPQNFWKIIAPIYIIMDVVTFIFPSQAMKDYLYTYDSIPALTLEIVLEIITLYMLIKYAYSNEVYKIEEKEEKS